MNATTLAMIQLGAMFFGLEYTATELFTGMRRSWMAGLLDLVLNTTPGIVVALMLGLGPTGALAMAGVTYISSSGIIAKVLNDLGRLGNRETPVILSILVFEDLAMAAYPPVLTAVLAGLGFWAGLQSLAIALLSVTAVLVVALRYGRYVSAVVASEDREIFLLKLLGAALLVAGVASALQVSAAVGAFLLGIAGLAVSAGALPEEFAALATTYVLLMAVIGPIAARVVQPTLRLVTRQPKPEPETVHE